MLNETLSKLLKASYEEGEKLVKDYESLTEALENNTIPPEEIVDRVGSMSLAFNEWKIRHEMLVSLGISTSDVIGTEGLYEMVKGGT